MALSIIWLFAFQNLYGYVYQRIGWIIALFMGGLVIGCELVNRRSRGLPEPKRLLAYLWRWLILVDGLLALLALAIPFALPAFGVMQSTPQALTLVEWCVSIMVALTGVLGGAAFALAGRLQLQTTGRPGSAAGTIVGADHAGACLGALLSGILLVPVFGTAAAAFILAGIKLTSVALLAVGRQAAR
jgi:spermidine synthase